MANANLRDWPVFEWRAMMTSWRPGATYIRGQR